MKRVLITVVAVLAAVTLATARTDVRRPKTEPQPPKVKFSEFAKVELKAVEIAPEFVRHKANQKAAAKIGVELALRMREKVPYLVAPPEMDNPKEKKSKKKKGAEEAPAAAPPPEGARTLVIEPYVEQIKFISGGARYWAGALAGNSAVLIKATFRDKATGEVVAEPEFYDDANAYQGAWSIGAADNMMLVRVAEDIAEYYSQYW